MLHYVYILFFITHRRSRRLLLLINGNQLAAYVQVPAATLIMPTDQRVMAMVAVLKRKGDEDYNYGVNDLSKNQSKHNSHLLYLKPMITTTMIE